MHVCLMILRHAACNSYRWSPVGPSNTTLRSQQSPLWGENRCIKEQMKFKSPPSNRELLHYRWQALKKHVDSSCYFLGQVVWLLGWNIGNRTYLKVSFKKNLKMLPVCTWKIYCVKFNILPQYLIAKLKYCTFHQ